MVKCKVFMLLVTAKSQYFAQSNHRIPPKNPQDPQKKKTKIPKKIPKIPKNHRNFSWWMAIFPSQTLKAKLTAGRAKQQRQPCYLKKNTAKRILIGQFFEYVLVI
jgi:hypothetical protein